MKGNGLTSKTYNHGDGNLFVRGRIGIGTTSLQSELTVNGTITAKEVKVTLEGWPDYVFGDTYRLIPLDELKQYIEIHKSLPGVPTEKEVAANGMNVGKMQSTLLEKIEELTLYMIELKQENENLKKRIRLLEKAGGAAR